MHGLLTRYPHLEQCQTSILIGLVILCVLKSNCIVVTRYQLTKLLNLYSPNWLSHTLPTHSHRVNPNNPV